MTDVGKRGVCALEPAQAASKRLLTVSIAAGALSSLESVEAMSPALDAELAARALALKERCRNSSKKRCAAVRSPDGMMDILNLMPKATIPNAPIDLDIADSAKIASLLTRSFATWETMSPQRLLETLQTAPPAEAAEAIGLVRPAFPGKREKILPARLSQWAAFRAMTVAVRQLSAAPPEERARLLVALYDSLDVMIRGRWPFDEMGMSGQSAASRN